MSLELEKEEVVQTLCAHYAQDHLSTGELEARFERVYQSADKRQLLTVLDGLPALNRMAPAPPPLYEVGAPSRGGLAPDEKRYLALFSQVNKEGHWTPSRRIAGRAIMGGILLDLRDAVLPPEGIDIELDVIMGEGKVILPPGVRAEVDCTAIMAEVSDKGRPALPGAPVVRVTGSVVMGSIEVVTKLPKKQKLEGWRAQLKGLLGVADHDNSKLY
ncbi:MAG: hypothetical protein ACKVS7_10590 [Gemmatimonadaceae bacterium]